METKTEPASFAGTNLEPDAVIPGIPNASHVWQWGVRWGSTPFSHVETWCDDEDDARLMLSTTRGERCLIRRMLIQCPAEVVA